jgi:TPR repeat protein
MQNESSPEYTAPPAGPGPLRPPASKSNFSPASMLGFAAALLLALYAFWPALQPLWSPARRAPLPGGETRPVSQASGVQGRVGGEAAPERSVPAAVQAESLTQPGGVPREEDAAPPLPGLLTAPPPTLDNVSYTGPATSPDALAKETSEDRAGCKTGDMLKCLRMGMRYIAGHGVERNAERGFALINKACAGGVAEACTSQGIMQLTGHGTAQDETAAFALFDKACGAGDMYGCTMLASGYLGDKSTPADISRGLGLLGKACDAKLAQACSLLGTIYAEGKLAPRDAAAADRLLGKACGLQNKNACQLQQQLRTHAAAEKDR